MFYNMAAKQNRDEYFAWERVDLLRVVSRRKILKRRIIYSFALIRNSFNILAKLLVN